MYPIALALLASLAVPTPAVTIAASPDSATERRVLRAMSTCLVRARPKWARDVLALPYMSAAQGQVVARALSGRDSCVRGAETALRFRTSGVVGSLAEAALTEMLGDAGYRGAAKRLETADAKGVSEDFALCVAARNPDGARALLRTELGSDAETGAAQALATQVGPCTNAGEKFTLDVQSLRTLMAVAFYRGNSVKS